MDISSQFDPGYMTGLWVRGPRLLLQVQAYMIALDISRPAEPRLIDPGVEALYYGPPPPVAAGQVAYVAVAEGLALVDMSDPASPALIGRVDTADFVVTGLAATDQTLVVVGRKETGANADGAIYTTRLLLFDISDPKQPRELSRLEPALPGLEFIWTAALAGDQLYLHATTREGQSLLAVLDVTDPARPVAIGRYSLSDSVSDLVPAGERLYLVTDGGILVVKAGEGGRPYGAGRLPGSGLALAGDRVLTAAGSAGLFIWQEAP